MGAPADIQVQKAPPFARIGDAGWLAIIMVAAICLRLSMIDRQSLWVDEAYSLWFARHSFADLWGSIARLEFNPPLYAILLRAWILVFGESELALRSLSGLLNTAAIPFVYLTARWSLPGPSGRCVGLLAAALFALSFMQLQFSQEARAISLAVLAIAMTSAASGLIIRRLNEPALTASRPPMSRYAPFAMLGGASALAFWSHYTTGILLAALAGFHLIVWLTAGRRSLDGLLGFAIAGGVFILLAGRAVWLMLAYALPGSDDFWVDVPTLPSTLDAASIIFGGVFDVGQWSAEIGVRVLLFAPWPILAMVALWRSREPGHRLALLMLFSLSFGVFALFLLVTLVGKPIFLHRLLVPAQVGWVVLSAAALLISERPGVRWAIAGLVTTSFALGTYSFFVRQPGYILKEPWREAMQEISARSPGAAVIYCTGGGQILIEYYLQRLGRTDVDIVALNGDLRIPSPRMPFERSVTRFSDPIAQAGKDRLAAAFAGEADAWVLVRNPDGERLKPITEVLAAHDNDLSNRILLNPGPLGLYHLDTTSTTPTTKANRE